MHARRLVDAAVSVAALAALLTLHAHSAAAIGTAFTYQGQLLQSGTPVNGNCDLQFGLFVVPSDGVPLGGSLQVNSNVTVDHGLFTVTLDFGPVFDSLGDRFLEIGSRCPSGSGEFTILAPRQLITGTPYALGLVLPWVATIETDQTALFVTNTGTGATAAFSKPFNLNPTQPTLSASAGGLGSVAVNGESTSGAGCAGTAPGRCLGGRGTLDRHHGGTGACKIEGSTAPESKASPTTLEGDLSQSLKASAAYFDGAQVISRLQRHASS
jgi:hypothetical protein